MGKWNTPILQKIKKISDKWRVAYQYEKKQQQQQQNKLKQCKTKFKQSTFWMQAEFL